MTTRKEFVKKLLSEGFNRSTIIMMSDNELKTLCKTLFNESVMIKADSPTASKDIEKAKKQGKTIETYESKGEVCPVCGMKECSCKDKKHGNKTKNVKGKKENTELSEWVLSLAESNFTKFTSKKDIMGIINEKVMTTLNPMPGKAKIGHNGVPVFMTYDSIVGNQPSTAPSPNQPEVLPDAPPREKPDKPKKGNPYQPGPGTDPKPQASTRKKINN
jgi:hypothetical protein